MVHQQPVCPHIDVAAEPALYDPHTRVIPLADADVYFESHAVNVVDCLDDRIARQPTTTTQIDAIDRALRNQASMATPPITGKQPTRGPAPLPPDASIAESPS